MSEIHSYRSEAEAPEAASFIRSFVTSEAFKVLFREGMALVEATAVYLDGPGRDDSRGLSRDGALTYATESMRLTTRLMQMASWLLVQRAVSENEISPEQARNEKNRVRLSDAGSPSHPDSLALLPEALRDLIDQSLRMQTRIRHLEGLMDGPAPVMTQSPVARQIDRLAAAFPGLR